MINNNWRSRTPTHNSWAAMKQRCYYKKSAKYPRYGARGIKVCDQWLHSFDNFLRDMGERPEGMTLDRIDNNGDYTPENCRWATHSMQMRNRSFRGTVKLRSGNFGARIIIDGESKYLGTFETEDEAHRVYELRKEMLI